jgi:hypothetical protein
METLIVKIKKQNKAAFTKELLKSFDFLEVKEEKSIVIKPGLSKKRKAALAQGFKEMKLVEQGKLKIKSGADLLKELKNGKN